MGDLVDYEPYCPSRTFLSLLEWFLIPSALLDMDDPYGRIGDELISRLTLSRIILVRKEGLLGFES